MRRKTRTLLVGLLVVALAPVTAAPAAAENQVERPYKGRTVTTVATLDGVNFTYSGTGNFAHMGKVVESGTFTGTFIEGPCELLDGGTGFGVFTAVGTFTTVAADGSTLYGTFDNAICIPGETAVTGTRYITGGTGRFEGATGEAAISGVSTSESTELIFDGRIEY